MARLTRLDVSAGHATQVMRAARDLLPRAVPGAAIRHDLSRDDRVAQLNAFVGTWAGVEFRCRVAQDGERATIHACRRGFAEYRLKAWSILFGAIVGGIAVVALLIDGFVGDSFVARSAWNASPHVHGGAMVLYAVVPGIVAGILATAATWPLSWLTRGVTWVVNRRLGLESPARLLARACESAGVRRGASA